MAQPSARQDLLDRIAALEQENQRCRRSIAALQENEERFRDLFDHAHDLIHAVSPEGRILYVNQAWRETLGYTDQDLTRLHFMDLIDASVRPKCARVFECLMGGEKLDRNETMFVAKDGRRVIVEGRCHVQEKDGRPVALLSIFREITDQKNTEAALQENEQRYRELFENAHDLIQMLRPDGRFLFVNRAWQKVMGYSEAEAQQLKVFDVIAPECLEGCRAVFQRVLKGERLENIETEFRTRSGRTIILEGNIHSRLRNGTPELIQCIFRDVSERKRMEEELLKSQKLESVGVFAGGIAHDFNNMLTAILGNISLARIYANKGSKLDQKLQDIEKATLRATTLTHQLLTFSKGGEPIKEILQLADLLPEAGNFALRGSNVRSEYRFPPDLWPVKGDAGQLSQVIQNLALNADQAMPEGGTLSIQAENVILKPQQVPSLPAGKYVRVTVTDQGTGIPKKFLGKIFDPYFSTKQKGSGLGLAVAYSVIKNHGGQIIVESRQGTGTTFSLFLPAAAGREIKVSEAEPEVFFGQGNILVMDDEEEVRNIAVELLHYLGYRTETAADGAEALARFKAAHEQGKPFDGVLMDLTIPGGMGGLEALQEMLRIDPETRAVVSSGYATNPVMADYRRYGFKGVTPKPYRLQELSRTLHQILAT